jgi:hypothetical protein
MPYFSFEIDVVEHIFSYLVEFQRIVICEIRFISKPFGKVALDEYIEFYGKICVCGKNVVLLHPLLRNRKKNE